MHTRGRRPGQWHQADSVAGGDQLLDKFQAVDPVHDAGGEPGERGKCQHRVLVGGVAGVHDPPAIGVVRQVRRGVGRRRPEAPVGRPEPVSREFRSEGRGGEVVVVGQCQVDLVPGQQVEGLQRLELVDGHHDPGMRPCKVADDGQQRTADGGGESGHPQRAGGFGRRVEIQPGGVDGGQDRHRVGGQPVAGGRQPHPASVGLQQCGPGVVGQCRELLGDGGRRRPEFVGDLAHRTQSGQLQQQP